MRFQFTVHFDETDTENWSEEFTVIAPSEDDAWSMAKNEARARSRKFGHHHEYTLEINRSNGGGK